MEVCKICMEDTPRFQMRNGTINCSHSYCPRCITKHIASKVKENITLITCPDYNCKEILEPHFCKDTISRKVLDRWESALRESSNLQVQHQGGDEDMLLIQLAKKNNWRKCPGCKYYVEKTMGCVDLNFAMAVEPHGVTLMKPSVRESKITNVNNRKIGRASAL
ncbi:hypothetical protein MKW92_027239 [Papaver armeniacum]|nr:hypothetical protein MKW92_027239 [Papaver armeniacum]